jgi:peroxiredoxin
MRIPTWFIGVTATSIAMAAIAVDALFGVPDDPNPVQPISVSSLVRTFAANTVDARLRSYGPDSDQQPPVIIVYRGRRCPYRDTRLSEAPLFNPELRAHRFEIVLMSTDQPKPPYSSLKATDIHDTLLSDRSVDAAGAFHVAYRVEDATLATMREDWIDLELTTGIPLQEPLMPSVCIIDTVSTIRHVYSNSDYALHLSGDELWATIEPFANL